MTPQARPTAGTYRARADRQRRHDLYQAAIVAGAQGRTRGLAHALCAAPRQTSRYSAMISALLGTRGLLLGLPEASACSAIKSNLAFQIASSMPYSGGLGTDRSLFRASRPATRRAPAGASSSVGAAKPMRRAASA